MKIGTMKAGIFAVTLAAAAVSSAFAQGPGPGYGPGYGPGMMGGYGPGPGMMGGYGRGYGPGPGYGRGYGPGGGLAALNLSDEQRDKIAAIQEEHRKKNWDRMGQMRSEQFKLRRMYSAEKVDPAAVGEQQKKVDDLRRQVIQSRVEARNQVQAVLTPEQRKQFRQFGPWWMEEDE
jgi:Spy/CpxP family protein refolding chaperone